MNTADESLQSTAWQDALVSSSNSSSSLDLSSHFGFYGRNRLIHFIRRRVHVYVVIMSSTGPCDRGVASPVHRPATGASNINAGIDSNINADSAHRDIWTSSALELELIHRWASDQQAMICQQDGHVELKHLGTTFFSSRMGNHRFLLLTSINEPNKRIIAALRSESSRSVFFRTSKLCDGRLRVAFTQRYRHRWRQRNTRPRKFDIVISTSSSFDIPWWASKVNFYSWSHPTSPSDMKSWTYSYVGVTGTRQSKTCCAVSYQVQRFIDIKAWLFTSPITYYQQPPSLFWGNMNAITAPLTSSSRVAVTLTQTELPTVLSSWSTTSSDTSICAYGLPNRPISGHFRLTR